jgi:hypothetical protein
VQAHASAVRTLSYASVRLLLQQTSEFFVGMVYSTRSMASLAGSDGICFRRHNQTHWAFLSSLIREKSWRKKATIYKVEHRLDMDRHY